MATLLSQPVYRTQDQSKASYKVTQLQETSGNIRVVATSVLKRINHTKHPNQTLSVFKISHVIIDFLDKVQGLVGTEGGAVATPWRVLNTTEEEQ